MEKSPQSQHDHDTSSPSSEHTATREENDVDAQIQVHQTELPRDWLQRCSKLRPLRDESHSHFLLRVGTANLKGMHLTHVPVELQLLRNLRMLYLYDNFLSGVNNLERNQRLQSLYLDNNHLTSLRGIGSLPQLTKLCANNNCIAVIDGLADCDNLQELHISNQRLPAHSPGVKFDGFTIDALAQCLTTLVCCNNRVADDANLTALRRLEVLTLDNNLLTDIEVIKEMCTDCYSLRELSLVGNPVSRVHGYRDAAILASDLMTTLDRKAVPANQREFLQAREMRRRQQQQTRSSKSRSSMGSSNSHQEFQQYMRTDSRESTNSRPSVSSFAAAQPTQRFNMVKRRVPEKCIVKGGRHMRQITNKHGGGVFHHPTEQLSNAVVGAKVQNYHAATQQHANNSSRGDNQKNMGATQRRMKFKGASRSRLQNNKEFSSESARSGDMNDIIGNFRYGLR
jgi:Leucine-rich repeat (LRR) protein